MPESTPTPQPQPEKPKATRGIINQKLQDALDKAGLVAITATQTGLRPASGQTRHHRRVPHGIPKRHHGLQGAHRQSH